jgi:hypothetical protein
MNFNDHIVRDVKSVFSKYDYTFFENDSKNYNLNLVGIRTKAKKVNTFDDILLVLWNYKGWNVNSYIITTDPGLYWLRKPMNVDGTAIVKPGQYRGVWKKGTHKGYPALQQIEPITVIRDYNRDDKLNYNSGVEQTGLFGINLHKSYNDYTERVGKWSAGCQVFRDGTEFDDYFMPLIDKAAKMWGNSFTYTLVCEEDFNLK